MCGADVFLAVLAVFFPPIAVWIKVGLCTADSIINIALCCLGYLPGLIHAWYIILKYPDSDDYPEGYEPIDPSRADVEGGRRVTYHYVSSRQPAAQPQPQPDRRYGATETSAPQVPSQTRPGNSSTEQPSGASHPPTYAEALIPTMPHLGDQYLLFSLRREQTYLVSLGTLQPLQSGLALVRPASSVPLSLSLGNPAPRNSSICLRCQFRSQLRCFTSKPENDSLRKPDTKLENLYTAFGADKDFSSPTAAEENLPSASERRRSQLSKQFTNIMDNIQSNIFIAGQRLNDLTGYSGIESLKREIETQENQVLDARSIVRQTKDAYSAAINRRSASQREVNELLQRKHAWSPADLERFTSLYRSDHTNEIAEVEAQEALTKAEHDLEEATAKLNRSILSRYHEEQIWSDKIRRMSTWGTWGLMGVNVLLFLIFQILVEPWRRQRLVKGFEEKVKEAIETEAAASRAIVAGLTRTYEAEALTAPVPVSEDDAVLEHNTEEIITENDSSIAVVSSPVDGAPPYVVSEQPSKMALLSDKVSTLLSTEYWKQFIRDTFSDRHVVLTQRELTNITIQSAAAGATSIGVIALIALLRQH
ncbi:hypothetical protein UA08_06538 [Talaromyces atroroseus]|uniref:Sensitive to high expression protein 9, mitochondrial n=1 Tax=Talaromyces atroroseus TaxID=1441469 RepID=A0A225AV52_TALAT|nr:hypothetical protein UA08_06538 [Talaromyces atroroseus]OKL58315.1 hypothetical protein UA08_06538 [Talaromyces atroroseus]